MKTFIKHTRILPISLIYVLITIYPSLNSQEVNKTQIDESLKKFIPKGYTLLSKFSGDLNLDPLPDMILVLKKEDEESNSELYEETGKRPLLILIGQKDKSYILAGRNDSTVLCFRCGGVFGDPFQGITIKNGYFSVEHYGGSNWRWVRIITYKYNKNKNDWYLSRIGNETYHTMEPNKVEKTSRTPKDFGEVKFSNYDIYKE